MQEAFNFIPPWLQTAGAIYLKLCGAFLSVGLLMVVLDHYFNHVPKITGGPNHESVRPNPADEIKEQRYL